MKKKVAIINQRYGAEVNGGSEYYTKKLAEHLQEYYDIEVLTTTALDYDTWKPYYQVGRQVVDGVTVHRFSVEKTRNMNLFRIFNKMLRTFPILLRGLEGVWLKEQGPYCPEMIDYIRYHRDDYDTYIFVTYLYYTTVLGLPEVAEKAIFVPTAHDEYSIYFQIYRKLFNQVKGIVYLTKEEQCFVQSKFKNENVPYRIAGTGIEVPACVDVQRFKEKYQINTKYIAYVGRVDVGKNCDVMFQYFERYCVRKKIKDLKLVVAGKMMMEKPKSELIQTLGFLTEDEKYAVIAGAKALIMPSLYESLSLVVLEAMALGTPVVVNDECSVLKGHCDKSGAGLGYRNYDDYEEAIDRLLKDEDLYNSMCSAGKIYIKKNYTWDKTVAMFKELIE